MRKYLLRRKGQRMLKLSAFIPMIAALAFPVLGSAETLINGARRNLPGSHLSEMVQRVS